MIEQYFNITFYTAAFILSAFFGFKACNIFSVPKPSELSQRFYLFWFNFCGSIIGWVCLWLLINQFAINIYSIVFVLISFAGITGHLPMATMGIFQGLSKITVGLFQKWFN